MQHARFVRMLGPLLVLGLAGFGGGCGPGSSAPMGQEESKQIKEARKNERLQFKAEAKKTQEAIPKQGDMRRGAHRGP